MTIADIKARREQEIEHLRKFAQGDESLGVLSISVAAPLRGIQISRDTIRFLLAFLPESE